MFAQLQKDLVRIYQQRVMILHILIFYEVFEAMLIKQLTEEKRRNMTAIFNLEGVELIFFFFCDDLFADDTIA